MGRWSREELESAFDNYRAMGKKAGTTGDWTVWADLFTEDATYVEHMGGVFGGRDALLRLMGDAMSKSPMNEMRYFPVEWYIIDEERGWIVACIWNRMQDPGDGSIFQAENFTLLKYAGNGRFSYEEDIYNPAKMMGMIADYVKHRDKLAVQASKAGDAPP